MLSVLWLYRVIHYHSVTCWALSAGCYFFNFCSPADQNKFCANNVDPDEIMSRLIRIYIVCHPVLILTEILIWNNGNDQIKRWKTQGRKVIGSNLKDDIALYFSCHDDWNCWTRPWGYKTSFVLNSAKHDSFSAGEYETANNIWYFRIYYQRKFHAQLCLARKSLQLLVLWDLLTRQISCSAELSTKRVL